MKIVTKKQMNLHELIKYVWENELKADNKLLRFESQVGSVVEVDMSGQVRVYGQHYGNELFTVEVEEKLTEETVLDRVTVVGDVFGTPFSEVVTGISISEIISNDIGANHKTKTMYYLDGNYRTTHIWAEEHGIPTEGTLEI